jgi:vacuolar-type H+-ATPase subunit I/STV1
MTSERYLNRAEASKAIGKSEPTLDGYLKAGKFPNAKKVKTGKRETWQIPLTDLVSAGLLDKVESQPEADTASALPKQVMSFQEQLNALQELATLRAENQQLRDRLVDAERARQDLISAYAPRIETAERQAQRRRFWFSRG